ncbi:MAG: choloylglycine hydrolase family protein [Lachnospiraceae bacterium]|nr:choloylglycine hydrolase family protein [Lachnospiraceae bacterium]
MCTALTYKTRNHYFGRNLDIESCNNEKVIIVPRNFRLSFRQEKDLYNHYAMIGIGIIRDGYPLYYDGTNEKGLSMAGLNFPDNAEYKPIEEGRSNITPYEFIPWILGQCATISEVREKLKHMNLVNINFSEELLLSPLHWMISDREESITVEVVKNGLHVYDNPVGILTNNPVFDVQMFNLNNYMHITTSAPENSFSDMLNLKPYSCGMGALGLPGDYSSASRFVKASFIKMNSVSGDSESESISQFFHILGAVAFPKGCVCLGEGKYEMTVYSSCCNVDKGIYYYVTYENSRITGVDMYKEDLSGNQLVIYPMLTEQQVWMQN